MPKNCALNLLHCILVLPLICYRKLFLEGVAPKPINQEEPIDASEDENVLLQDGESREKEKKNKGTNICSLKRTMR